MSTRHNAAMLGTAASFIQYGLQIALQALVTPFILKWAGKEALGAYAVLMQALGYLALADLGFTLASGRYLARAHGTEDGGKLFSDVLSITRNFQLFTNIVYGILCLVAVFCLGQYSTIPTSLLLEVKTSLIILALWVLIRTPLTVYGAALNATQNLALNSAIAVVANVIKLSASLIFLYLGCGVVGLVSATILAEATGAILQSLWFRRMFPFRPPKWAFPSGPLFAEMFRFGLNGLLASIAVRLVYQSDQLIVSKLFGLSAAAIYYSTQMPGTLLYQLVLRLADNAGPGINELHAKDMFFALKSVFLRISRYTLLLALPVAVGISCETESLISLWLGAGQYAGNSVAVGLGVFSLCVCLAHINVVFLLASGEIKLLGLLGLIEGVAHVAFAFAAGKYFGLQGIIWGGVLAALPCILIMQLKAHSIYKITAREYIAQVITPSLVPGFGAVIISIVMWRAFSATPNWGGFIGMIITTCILSCGLAIKMALTPEERNTIMGLIYRMRTRLLRFTS